MPVNNPAIKALVSGRLGTNGATSYTDEFGNTWTGTNGGVLTTASPPFPPQQVGFTFPSTAAIIWSGGSLPSFVLGSGDFRAFVWFNQSGAGEAVYVDNDGQNGTAGWRLGCWNSGGGPSLYDIYFYSDVGGFFTFNAPVQPNGAGPRCVMVERTGTAANNCRIYYGDATTLTRIGQYSDNTNYSRQATNVLLGRGANNLAFRPFVGTHGGVQVETGAAGTFTNSGTSRATPNPLDPLVYPASESSAGTADQDRVISVSGDVAESSAGTDTPNRSVAASAAAAETSAGTDTPNRTVTTGTRAVGESSAGTDTPNRTVALTGAATESSAGTADQDWVSPNTFGVAESSVGDTTQNRNTPTVPTRAVTESVAGTTAQDRTLAPPAGVGASGVRRWLVQYYEGMIEKRRKSKEIAELSKEIEQASAGMVAAPKKSTPVVILTDDAKKAADERHALSVKRHFDEMQAQLLAAQQKVEIPKMPETAEMLQRHSEQDDEDDHLLLAAIL